MKQNKVLSIWKIQKTSGLKIDMYLYLEKKPAQLKLVFMWVLYQGRVRIWKNFVEGRKPQNPEKNPRSKARTDNRLYNTT